MLAKLSISTWSARKFDKRVSDEINAREGAVSDAGRYNKHLLGGSSAAQKHADVISAAGAARLVHYAQTLPWSDEGWRLLPTDNWTRYTDAIRAATAKFQANAQDFIAEYHDMKDRAKVLLNGMFKEEDYPSLSEIARRFSCSIEYAPIPATGDLRVALPAGQVEEIERQIEERIGRATEDAMRDAWSRLAEVVERVKSRLSDPDAVFRDSLIGNVRETCDILSRLNLTQDPSFESMRRRIDRELGDLDPQSLREWKPERDKAARKAQEIVDAMSGLYGAAT